MSRPNPKELTLAFVFIAVQAFTFLVWRDSLARIADQNFEFSYLYPASLVGLVIAVTLAALASIFITNQFLLYGAVAASMLVPLLTVPATNGTLIVLILTILLALGAVWRTANESSFSLGFSLHKLFRAGIPLYLTAAALLNSYFYFLEVKQSDIVGVALPRPAFDLALRIFAEPIKSLTGNPSFRPDVTVDEFLEAGVRAELNKQQIADQRISDADIKKMTELSRRELASRYGVELKGNEKLSDALRETVTARMQDLLGPYRRYMPYAGAIAFFLAFKTLTIPLYFISLALAFFLIKGMIAAKIMKKETRQVEVSRLTL